MPKILGGIAAVIVLAAVVFEWRFGVLLPSARSPRPYAAEQAGVFVVVDPAQILPLSPELVEHGTGLRLPRWAADRVTPHEAGAAAMLDIDARRINVTAYLNLRRLGPWIGRQAAEVDPQTVVPQVKWIGKVRQQGLGLLLLDGTIPVDPGAVDSYWTVWNQSLTPPPLTPEGGHFIEVVFDNRRGSAYVTLASILAAYNIVLDGHQHDITLSSLQFVREARITVDFDPPDAFRLRLMLEIVPDAIDRLGVINLKVGLQDALTDVANRWQIDYGLKLTGKGRWEKASIVYDYRLEGAAKALGLLLDGQLH